MRVICPERVLLRASADARARLPAECCGVLVGQRTGGNWRLADYLPLRNRSHRTGAFAVDPVEFIRAEADARARGWQLCGFLHSHPDGNPIPSGVDRRHAWPGYLQIIWPVHGGIPGTPRAWFPRRGELRSVAMETP